MDQNDLLISFRGRMNGLFSFPILFRSDLAPEQWKYVFMNGVLQLTKTSSNGIIFMQVRATQKTIYTVLTIWGSCFKIYRNTPPEWPWITRVFYIPSSRPAEKLNTIFTSNAAQTAQGFLIDREKGPLDTHQELFRSSWLSSA